MTELSMHLLVVSAHFWFYISPSFYTGQASNATLNDPKAFLQLRFNWRTRCLAYWETDVQEKGQHASQNIKQCVETHHSYLPSPNNGCASAEGTHFVQNCLDLARLYDSC